MLIPEQPQSGVKLHSMSFIFQASHPLYLVLKEMDLQKPAKRYENFVYSQAGPGRICKQEQEETSRNHTQAS